MAIVTLKDAARTWAALTAIKKLADARLKELKGIITEAFDENGAERVVVTAAGEPAAHVIRVGEKTERSIGVTDERAFLAWLDDNVPAAVMTVTTRSYSPQVLDRLVVAEDGTVAYQDTGEEVPGVALRSTTRAGYLTTRFNDCGEMDVVAEVLGEGARALTDGVA